MAGRFPGFLAVQIEVIVPRKMPAEYLDSIVESIKTQAKAVIAKGRTHTARADSDDPQFDRVMITCAPTTPNAPWRDLSMQIQQWEEAARPPEKPAAPDAPAEPIPVHLATCPRKDQPVTSEKCRGCGAWVAAS